MKFLPSALCELFPDFLYFSAHHHVSALPKHLLHEREFKYTRISRNVKLSFFFLDKIESIQLAAAVKKSFNVHDDKLMRCATSYGNVT